MEKKQLGYVVAVVGATGAVGTEMIEVLEERKFPVARLVPLASTRSAGGTVTFDGNEVTVEVLTKDSFAGVDIALFSAGADLSREFAPIAVKAGAVVIDNSAAWRMTPDVPLVVPEVNAHDIQRHKGIIANPNCSTIQMVVALKPLHDEARIKRIVVTTFQSVSGTGKDAMDELMAECQDLLSFKSASPKVYPYQIAFNCLPHIDDFLPSGTAGGDTVYGIISNQITAINVGGDATIFSLGTTTLAGATLQDLTGDANTTGGMFAIYDGVTPLNLIDTAPGADIFSYINYITGSGTLPIALAERAVMASLDAAR